MVMVRVMVMVMVMVMMTVMVMVKKGWLQKTPKVEKHTKKNKKMFSPHGKISYTPSDQNFFLTS